MSVGTDPYALPTDNFVAGETRDLGFSCYFDANGEPFSLAGCTASFSVVHSLNKNGAPVICKDMTISLNADGTFDNRLLVTLLSAETLDLDGKYEYQISIKDVAGDIEIPGKGILYITNNHDRDFPNG